MGSVGVVAEVNVHLQNASFRIVDHIAANEFPWSVLRFQFGADLDERFRFGLHQRAGLQTHPEAIKHEPQPQHT